MMPTSGAGAAVKEYRQVSTLIPPGTLVSYRVTLAPVIDFRKGYRPVEWPPLWEEFFCDWWELWFNQPVGMRLKDFICR